MLDSLEIRAYRAGDEHDLTGLFERAFGSSITPAHWLWKLDHATSPVDNVWLALADDKPIFQYAGIPTRFRLFHAPACCMISVDTMTAPGFRRRGLLSEVGARAYGAWQRAGVAFVLGLPNDQWGSRAAALGWVPLFPLQWMVLPLRPEAMLARRFRLPWVGRATVVGGLWRRRLGRRLANEGRVHIDVVGAGDARFDAVWRNCRSDYAHSAVRDRRWVDWRFFASVSRAYSVSLAHRAGGPVGYSAHSIVQTPTHRVAQLADLFARRDDVATRSSLLARVVAAACEEEVDGLTTLAIPGTTHHSWLRAKGFLPRRQFAVQIVPLHADLPLSRLRDPGLWHLSGADFDVV